jgi:hypothetical protein
MGRREEAKAAEAKLVKQAMRREAAEAKAKVAKAAVAAAKAKATKAKKQASKTGCRSVSGDSKGCKKGVSEAERRMLGRWSSSAFLRSLPSSTSQLCGGLLQTCGLEASAPLRVAGQPPVTWSSSSPVPSVWGSSSQCRAFGAKQITMFVHCLCIKSHSE